MNDKLTVVVNCEKQLALIKQYQITADFVFGKQFETFSALDNCVITFNVQIRLIIQLYILLRLLLTYFDLLNSLKYWYSSPKRCLNLSSQ